VTGSPPTAQEAKNALADASDKATAVSRTDKQFRPILLVLAGMDLGAAALIGLFPQGGSLFAVVVFITVLAAGLIGSLLLLLRIRVYGRRGIRMFTVSIAAFTWWNAAVVGVSSASGWWGPHQPGTHFSVSAIIAAIPLLIAAWLVGRWR
jgi:hypothetical protein